MFKKNATTGTSITLIIPSIFDNNKNKNKNRNKNINHTITDPPITLTIQPIHDNTNIIIQQQVLYVKYMNNTINILWQAHIANTSRVNEQAIQLTGAGICVSTGTPDFRSENGLYSTLKDPSLFYSFVGDICPGFDDSKIKGKLLRNYTQKIDTLKYRAGTNNIITCHG